MLLLRPSYCIYIYIYMATYTQACVLSYAHYTYIIQANIYSVLQKLPLALNKYMYGCIMCVVTFSIVHFAMQVGRLAQCSVPIKQCMIYHHIHNNIMQNGRYIVPSKQYNTLIGYQWNKLSQVDTLQHLQTNSNLKSSHESASQCTRNSSRPVSTVEYYKGHHSNQAGCLYRKLSCIQTYCRCVHSSMWLGQ